MAKDVDSKFLAEALSLARRGIGATRPNPPVGAVIVRGKAVIGRGWHKKAGEDHAEVAAIKNARKNGKDPNGATLYVTLEPCSKAGRVGACTEAIVNAGISRVVYLIADPNPVNRGRAKRVLAKAGVVCEQAKDRFFGPLVVCGKHQLAPFRKHITTGLPFVTVKIAMSLDGRICDKTGDARWVSSEQARKETGRLRETVDVVMVGAETIRRDNPSLLCHTKKNANLYRAIISKSGRLPKDAQVFTDEAKDRTLVYRNPVEAMRDLGQRGFLHVLCEGGLKLATSLAEAGFVDEWITVLASKVIGTRLIAQATHIPNAVCLPD